MIFRLQTANTRSKITTWQSTVKKGINSASARNYCLMDEESIGMWWLSGDVVAQWRCGGL
jgi:hypothetical protein